MMKLIIKRSEWLRGEGADVSRLYRSSDGKMCCLGFLGLFCGGSREDMQGKGSPAIVRNINWPDALSSKGGGLLPIESTACLNLMNANDTQFLTNEAREQKLTEQFAAIDIQVEFVD